MTDPYEDDVWPLPRYSGSSKVNATWHGAAQISTETASDDGSGLPTRQGAREALVEQLAEAIDAEVCPHIDPVKAGGFYTCPKCAVRAVLPLLAAQVEAAVSVVRAEPGGEQVSAAPLSALAANWDQWHEAQPDGLTFARAAELLRAALHGECSLDGCQGGYVHPTTDPADRFPCNGPGVERVADTDEDECDCQEPCQ